MPQSTTNAVLCISDEASPPVYTQITEVGDIADAVGSTTNMHRVDSHSLNTPWGRQIPGLIMLNDTTFQVWFDPTDAQHAFDVATGLGYIHRNRVLHEYLFYYAGNAADAHLFDAYIAGVNMPVPVDGALMVEFTMAKTGAPTNVDAGTLNVTLDS